MARFRHPTTPRRSPFVTKNGKKVSEVGWSPSHKPLAAIGLRLLGKIGYFRWGMLENKISEFCHKLDEARVTTV